MHLFFVAHLQAATIDSFAVAKRPLRQLCNAHHLNLGLQVDAVVVHAQRG